MGDSRRQAGEQDPLLESHSGEEPTLIDFEKDDPENPRNWRYRTKAGNTFVIALMAALSPLVSSVFTPVISQIADSLDSTVDNVVGAASGYVVMLGVGPLILAPLSETFGRRPLYIVCFSIFTLLQIPTALAPDLATLITFRTIAGFFGSVSIANGGGTLNDLYDPSERATVFGWYLLGPLLGPTLGPIIGGVIAEYLSWRWMFAILSIVCAVNTMIGYLFLHETYAPTILEKRCRQLEKEHGGHYTYKGENRRPLRQKLLQSLKRPLRILITPIVCPIAVYQALIFSIMYTLYTNMETIFAGEPYHLSTLQTAMLYLGFGIGFIIGIRGIVPQIDALYNRMTAREGQGKPEFRLPLANIGAIGLPLTLFWFGWALEKRAHLAIVVASLPFFGISQVAIMNSVQNYLIDAFSDYAASAIAAGALFRSLVGGIVPLAGPEIFRSFGYGWGWSFFAFGAIILAPMPLLFMRFGERVRTKYPTEL